MAKLTKFETGLNGLIVIEPLVHEDDRGFFMESYNKRDFSHIGLNVEFVQENHSKSSRGVLRGLHYQYKHPQGKLVRVTNGRVWDVAVDLRTESPTFGQWFGTILSGKNKKLFYIPEGFAHGFIALEDNSELIYKCTDYYYPQFESGIKYNDENIGIQWPFEQYGIRNEEIVLSQKDKMLPSFLDYKNYF